MPTLAMLLGLDDALLNSVSAPAVHCAAVLCADHGLNTSTFAARVVASTGADLYACLSAGVAALSGPRHGGACERIEALVNEAERVGAERAVHDRLRRGETIPGFRHPLYPLGDPRTPPLLEAARAVAGPGRLDPITRLAEAMTDAGYGPPTLDFGLVAVARALELPGGGSTALFALGRCVGWVAHVLEQRTVPGLLRPRSRYVGLQGAPE
jgi:citrate synthase